MGNACESLHAVLVGDEFRDDFKLANNDVPYYSEEFVQFALEHAARFPASSWLDIGCGTGVAFSLLPITAAVEPNPERLGVAAVFGEARSPRVLVIPGWAEDLTFGDGAFSVVSYFRGFFQCRSDAEALIEINRVLQVGGVFLVDVPVGRAYTCFGRVWSKAGLVAWLLHFGFRLSAEGPSDGECTLFAFIKAADFSAATYCKPQLIPTDVKKEYTVRNRASLSWWMEQEFRNVKYAAVEKDDKGPLRIRILRGRVTWKLL